MSFDPQAIFANLAEKEKIKGHHSSEGRAIRTLGRALHGWSAGNLSAGDVLVLCDQAMEDWLKAKLKISVWSTLALPELMTMAVIKGWMTHAEAKRLERIRATPSDTQERTDRFLSHRVQKVLEFYIQLVEKHW